MAILRVFLAVGAGILVLTCQGQPVPPRQPVPAGPPRLIVRGDDMGFAHAANEAILKCYKEGIETSVEVMVNTPWFPEAVQMLAENPGLDAGVHLTLTSEWDTLKWRPLANVPSLRDPEGYFFPMIFPHKSDPERALIQQAWRLDEVEKEFRAQIELARRKIPRVSHLSGHMGCDSLSPEVRKLVRKLGKEYKLDIWPDELRVKYVGYAGPKTTSEEKLASFLKMLDGLEADRTYLFVDHPGLNTPGMQAIRHIGYEDVAVDRQGVTDTWTNPRVRKHLQARGIQLLSYKDLKKGR